MKSLGSWLLAMTLTIGVGCTRADWIDRTLVTENVTGVWVGGIEGRTNMRLELQHQGAQVTGFIKFLSSGMVAGGPPVPILGSMAGDLFTFKDERGVYSGELTVGGDEMIGRFFGGFGTRPISLQRANPSSPPTPPRP